MACNKVLPHEFPDDGDVSGSNQQGITISPSQGFPNSFHTCVDEDESAATSKVAKDSSTTSDQLDDTGCSCTEPRLQSTTTVFNRDHNGITNLKGEL